MYDYVTEDQYADIVNARIEDDWVVGDIKGSGYDDTGTWFCPALYLLLSTDSTVCSIYI